MFNIFPEQKKTDLSEKKNHINLCLTFLQNKKKKDL